MTSRLAPTMPIERTTRRSEAPVETRIPILFARQFALS